MKKAHYDNLLKLELEWIPNDSSCFNEFWVSEFTHIVISKLPNGKYQIIRSWYMDGPAVSVDMSNGTLEEVSNYLVRYIIDHQTHKFKLED